MKKFLLCFFSFCLVLVVSNINIFANENILQEEIITVQEGITDNINIKNNYLVIDNENIYTSDKSWDQPKGYEYYRIYATNTRNENMKLTLKYGSYSHTWTIPANDAITITASNAQPVKHYLSFSTSSGVVSGKVSVRVSDTPL